MSSLKMLKAIRKNVKKLGWPAATMIIIAFVLWGAPRLFRGRESPTFAGTIFGQKISFDEYYTSLRTCVWQAKLRYGDRFDQIQRYLDLEGQAWDRLILLAEARRLNLNVGDDEVRASIRAIPIFQTDGRFDPKEYNTLPNPRAFEEELRKTLVISKLMGSILSGVSVTDEEVRNEYEKEFSKARISYILVKHEDFKDKVILNEEELKSYYNQNQQIFRMPIQVNVEYLAFDYADYEDELAAKDRVEEIFYELIDNPDLAQVAEKRSLEVRETGFFTQDEPIPEIGFAPQFLDTAFGLEPGVVSEPIYAAKGCYILKVKEVREPYIPSFEEAKAKVKEVIIDLKAWELCENKSYDYHTQIKELMERSDANFVEAVAPLRLEVKDSGLISRGDYVPGVGENREFTEAAFDSEVGEVGPLIKTEKGYAILRLAEYRPIDEKEFDEAIEEYRTRVLELKKIEVYNQWFNELRQKTNLKSNLERIKPRPPRRT